MGRMAGGEYLAPFISSTRCGEGHSSVNNGSLVRVGDSAECDRTRDSGDAVGNKYVVSANMLECDDSGINTVNHETSLARL